MKFEWIVPVIVLVVWALNQLLRSRENEEPVRPRPGQQPAPGTRTAGNDIDRFLQEIDRLRRKSADERGEAERPRPTVAAPRPRPVAAPVPRARPVVRPTPARPAAPVAEVVVLDAAPPPVLVAATPVLPLAPTAAPRAPQVDRRGDQRSPAVGTALTLLRSPQTLASAFVLQEVLGPPKCRQTKS